MSDLAEAYKGRYGDLQRAMERLRFLLRDVEATIEDKTLVRAQASSFRIKELASLERKARRNGWKGEQALGECPDLIGARVVCNNVEDVYRFAALLKERLPAGSGAFEIQDYIKEPNPHGYRALHVNFRLDAGQSFAPVLISCEIQIRTRLQDAWGELTHGDIYKQQDLPQDLRERAKDLAEILSTADKIASAIRRRAVQEATAPEQRPDLRAVTPSGLAFIFREAFGRSAPDYVIQQALNICEELQISTLERLSEMLERNDLRDKLARTYQSIMPVAPVAEDLFLAALYAMARGDRRALSYIRRKARSEFREIDTIYRREMLSSLPDTVDDLIAQLEDPSTTPDVEGWAEALEATSSCKICGTTIVRPDTFADEVVRHYELSNPDDARERVERAIYQSSVERGGWNDSSLCAYHDDQGGKD